MTNSTVARRWAGLAVALLTIVWLLTMLALATWYFAIGLTAWADQSSSSTEPLHETAVAVMSLTFDAVGGAALIAVVAFASRLPRTGAVYVVLAFVLGALALPTAADAIHTLTLPDPPSSTPTICQEHSGGDNKCPGG